MRPLTRRVDRRHGRVAAAVTAMAVVTVTLPSCDDSGAPGFASAIRSASAHASLPVGTSAQVTEVGGLSRTYRVYRPAALSRPAALVVMLHGALGTGAQAESSYGWDAEADAAGFVVAYPDGYKRSWDVSGGCCGPPAAHRVDDVAFVERVVKEVSAAMPIDRSRVYATGISNGGMLAYRLACDTTTFAAIGVDSGTELNPCPSPAPLSVMHVHGLADQTIPFGGGPGRRDNGGTGSNPADTDGPSIAALLDTWRHVDDCAAPSTTRSGPISTWSASCPGHRAVELVTIAGAGHQWPGQRGPTGILAHRLDPPFHGFDATAAFWHFFAGHPRS